MPNLPIVVESTSPVNIKAQIAGQLQRLIALNELKPGEILPTVAELAKYLDVNHNTVAAVYNDLIKSGYLIAQRGKGTFVAEKEIVKKLRSHQCLYALLAEAYYTATQFGLSAVEFGVAAYSQALNASLVVATSLKVVFVASKLYREKIYEEIREEIGDPLSFFLLTGNKANHQKSLEKLIQGADLVITIAGFFDSVESIASPEQEIFVPNVKLNFELLRKLSSLPRSARLLVIADEKAESKEMQSLLEGARINHLFFQAIDTKDIQQNPKILKQAELFVVSPVVEDYIRQQVNIDDQVMVFNIRLDQDDMPLLKTRLATIELERLGKESRR